MDIDALRGGVFPMLSASLGAVCFILEAPSLAINPGLGLTSVVSFIMLTASGSSA